MELELHPSARAELLDAVEWYGEQDPSVGERFAEAVERVLDGLERDPGRWPEHRQFGVRRVRLTRFPYSIFYDVEEERVWILAVAHARRRPGYWLSRRR